MEQEIKIMLDQLAEIRSQIDVLNLRKSELIDSAMTPEIKAKLADIDAEYVPAINRAEENAEILTERIKTLALQNETSVRGKYIMAVYVKGRISWDTKKLDGMAALIPALAEARTQGNPSISIKRI